MSTLQEFREVLRGDIQDAVRVAIADALASGMRWPPQPIALAVPDDGGQNHFNVKEFSLLVKKTPYTVRCWCILGQINAYKSATNAGDKKVWVIERRELDRLRAHGLLPIDRQRNQRS